MGEIAYYPPQGATWYRPGKPNITKVGTFDCIGSTWTALPTLTPVEDPTYLPTRDPTQPTQQPTRSPTTACNNSPQAQHNAEVSSQPPRGYYWMVDYDGDAGINLAIADGRRRLPPLVLAGTEDFFTYPQVPIGSDAVMCVLNYVCSDTMFPTQEPTDFPTEQPTQQPTNYPTEQPTDYPSQQPTDYPTEQPTFVPTHAPTEQPTEQPTDNPTQQPTKHPSQQPTLEPTLAPTEEPSQQPTQEPTKSPTTGPTDYPTEQPTNTPTQQPSEQPTQQPTFAPTTADPSEQPTLQPTQQPTQQPSEQPTDNPTQQPTQQPSKGPTENPTHNPSVEPTHSPSEQPTEEPTHYPSEQPSHIPSEEPTQQPSEEPTSDPTLSPTKLCLGMDIQSEECPFLEGRYFKLADRVNDKSAWYSSDLNSTIEWSSDYHWTMTGASVRGQSIYCPEEFVSPTVLPTMEPTYGPSRRPTSSKGFCPVITTEGFGHFGHFKHDLEIQPGVHNGAPRWALQVDDGEFSLSYDAGTARWSLSDGENLEYVTEATGDVPYYPPLQATWYLADEPSVTKNCEIICIGGDWTALPTEQPTLDPTYYPTRDPITEYLNAFYN